MVISLPDEIWKDVPDFYGHYQVSNLGRVKSMTRKYLSHICKKLIHRKEKLLNQRPDYRGYIRVDLSKTGIAYI